MVIDGDDVQPSFWFRAQFWKSRAQFCLQSVIIGKREPAALKLGSVASCFSLQPEAVFPFAKTNTIFSSREDHEGFLKVNRRIAPDFCT